MAVSTEISTLSRSTTLPSESQQSVHSSTTVSDETLASFEKALQQGGSGGGQGSFAKVSSPNVTAVLDAVVTKENLAAGQSQGTLSAKNLTSLWGQTPLPASQGLQGGQEGATPVLMQAQGQNSAESMSSLTWGSQNSKIDQASAQSSTLSAQDLALQGQRSAVPEQSASSVVAHDLKEKAHVPFAQPSGVEQRQPQTLASFAAFTAGASLKKGEQGASGPQLQTSAFAQPQRTGETNLAKEALGQKNVQTPAWASATLPTGAKNSAGMPQGGAAQAFAQRAGAEHLQGKGAFVATPQGESDTGEHALKGLFKTKGEGEQVRTLQQSQQPLKQEGQGAAPQEGVKEKSQSALEQQMAMILQGNMAMLNKNAEASLAQGTEGLQQAALNADDKAQTQKLMDQVVQRILVSAPDTASSPQVRLFLNSAMGPLASAEIVLSRDSLGMLAVEINCRNADQTKRFKDYASTIRDELGRTEKRAVSLVITDLSEEEPMPDYESKVDSMHRQSML